ncbi:MAG: hypothetical protein MZW92_31585 [Comamonadaceae bacterium]|nr:hypothetical protein [Comamonadaceae bacterium]
MRAFKVAGSGANEWGKALQWNRMKQDTGGRLRARSSVHAGTALLARLRDAIARGMKLDRITLVGHSTGAIYIAHWLAHSRDYLPATLKQDIVYLAPAITYDLFARTLDTHGARVGGFRLFGMQDAPSATTRCGVRIRSCRMGRTGAATSTHRRFSISFPGSLSHVGTPTATARRSRRAVARHAALLRGRQRVHGVVDRHLRASIACERGAHRDPTRPSGRSSRGSRPGSTRKASTMALSTRMAPRWTACSGS